MVNRLRRLVLGAFCRLMPVRAANWFEGAILTPRPVPPPRGVTLPDGAATMRIPYGAGWLSVRIWGEGRTVLLLHGWGGSSVSVGAFVAPLLARGFRVVAVDLPAHGDSDGRRTNLIECAGAALQVGRAFGPLHAVIAHSFGGMVAALAARHGLAYERLVLLGAARTVYEPTLDIAEVIGLPRRVAQLMTDRFAARLRFRWEDLYTDRLLAPLDAAVTVVHDREDRIVPFADGERIARAARNGRFVATEGLGHRGILTDRSIIATALDAVAEAPPEENRIPA